MAVVEDLEADARARGGQRDFDHSLTVDEGVRDELAHGELERWGLLSRTHERSEDRTRRRASPISVASLRKRPIT